MLLTVTIIVLSIINVVSCVLLVLVVLMQRSKNDGIGAAFGGGITDSVFGSQTSNVLVKATTVLAIAFLLSATLLASAKAYEMRTKSPIQKELLGSETTNTAPVNSSTNAPSSTVPATTPEVPTVPNPTPVPVTPAKK